MKYVKSVALALPALALGLAASFAWANGDGKSDKAKEPAKVEIKQRADLLTHESLKEKLEGLGFEAKLIKSKGGTPMYLLDFSRGDFRYVFYVSLSTDKTRLWLSSALRPLPAGKDLRPDILEKILARNNEMGTTFFSVGADRYLYLQQGVDNRAFTTIQLRKLIDEFAGNMRSTEHLWSPAKYPKLEAPKAN
jgi:hypothetical protein